MALSLKINMHNYICEMGILIFVSDPGAMFVLFKMHLALICKVKPLPETNLNSALLRCSQFKGHSRMGSLDFFFPYNSYPIQLHDVPLRIFWMIFKLIFLQWIVFP